MAENRNLHVQLTVDADTRNAQNEFKQLQQTLQNISKNTISVNTESMQQASKAAQELQVHLEKAFNVSTGTLDLNKFSASLKASGNDLTSYRQKLEAIGTEGQQAFIQLAQSIVTADAPLMKANNRLTEFLGTLKNTARWQISSSILHGFMGSVQQAIGYAKDLNESLTNIQIVTNKSDEEMAKFAVSANKAAQALSTTTTKYTNASLIYFQQGLNAEEVEKRTAVTVKMMHATGTSAEQASSQLTSIWNNFYDGTKSLEYYADVITALGAATASSSEEISDGLQKFASIGETVGLSYEYAASALATITATSRESADTVGNALKTLFARIQSLKLGETLEDGVDLNKYAAAIEKVGVKVLDANGDLRDMDNILLDLMDRWGELDRASQTALAQTVAGQRQYAQFMTLMNNSDFFKENLDIAYDSSGTLEQQAQTWENSWQASSERVRAAIESIYQSLIDDDFFITINNGLATIFKSVNDIIGGMGGLQGVLGFIGSFITSKLANEAPNALRSIQESILIMTGKAEELASKTREGIIQELQKANVHNVSAEYDLQIEKLANIASLKADLKSKENELTEAQKQEYDVLIKSLEAEYERQAALAKTIDQKRESINQNKNEAYDQVAGQTTDQKALAGAEIDIDKLSQYAEAIGTIRTVTSEAQNLLKNFTSNSGQDFDALKEKTLAWIKQLEESGRVNPSNPKWKELKSEIENNTDSVVKLKQSIQQITDRNFEGLAQKADGSAVSVNELNQQVQQLVSHLVNKGVDENVIHQIIAESKDLPEVEAKLRSLAENVDTIVSKAPQVQGSWSKMFGKGTSLLMSFSSYLSGLTNLFTTLGDSSASNSQKIVTSIGAIIVVINLLKRTMEFSNSIAALSSLTGTFAGLGAAIAPIAPFILPVVVAVGALTAAFAANEAAARNNQKALEENAKTAKETAEQYKTEWDETKKQQEANEELIKTYQDCLTVFQETGTGRAALVEAAGAVVKALGLESEAVKIMRGDYQGLLSDILNVSDAKFEEAVKTAQAAKNTADAALIAEVQTSDSFVNTSGQLIDTSRWDWGIAQFRDFINDETNKSYGVLYDNLKNIYDKYQGQLDELIEREKQYWREQTPGITEEQLNSMVADVDFQTVFTDLGMKSEDDTLWASLHEEIQAQLDNAFTFELHFTDGDGNNWEDSVNQEIKTALDNLNMDYETDTFEKGGLQLNIEGQGIDGIIESYAKVKAIQDEVAANTQNPAALSNNRLWQELGDYLKLIEDEYGNVIDLQKELDSYLGKSTIRDIDKQFEGKIKSEDDYAELVETTLAKLREVGAYADQTDDEVRAIIDNYYAEIQKYQDFGSGVISTVQDAAKNAADNWDSSEIGQLYNMLSEEAQAAFDKIELTAGMKIKFKTDPQAVAEEVEELSKLINEQINNEENANKIGQNIDALDSSKFKTGMSLSELRKFQTDSNISWGETIEGMEEPIIKFSEFLKMEDSERVAYLEKLQNDLSNAQIQNLESTKKTLEDLQKYTKDVLIPEAEETAKQSRAKYAGMQTAQQNSQGKAYSQEDMDAARDQMLEDDLAVQQLYADVEKYGEEVTQVAEEAEINAEYAAQQITDAWKTLDSRDLKNGDTLSSEEISLLKATGIDLDQFSRETENGTREIYKDADELSEAIHIARQKTLLEDLPSEKKLSLFSGLTSQEEADNFDKQVEILKNAGADVSGFYQELSSTAGSWDKSSEAYKNYVQTVKNYNTVLSTEFLNGIESFKELKYWVEQGIIPKDSEEFEQVRSYLEDIGTWVNEVSSADDFIEKITPGADGIVELKDVANSYELIKNKISELNPDQFLTIGNAIEDADSKAKFFADNTNKVQITMDDLNNTELRGAMGEAAWEKAVEGIDTTAMSIDDLRSHIDDSGMTAEAYEKLLKEILGHDEVTTKDSIEALNEALLKGKLDAEEYLKLTKDTLTAQEQFDQLLQVEDPKERQKGFAQISKDDTATDDLRLKALEEEGKALQELQAQGEATDKMWQNYGADVAAVHKDIKSAAEEAFPAIVKAFAPEGEEISANNYQALGNAIKNVFDSIEGEAKDKLAAAEEALKAYGLTLEDVGLDLKDFADKTEEAFQYNFDENASFAENLENMNRAFEAGSLTQSEYTEKLIELRDNTEDWMITTEQASEILFDYLVGMNQMEGTLSKNARSIAACCNNMEDFESLLGVLKGRHVGEKEALQLESEALMKVASKYDSCSRELQQYQRALRGNNSEAKKSTKMQLELATRAAEVSKKYKVEESQVKALAKRYQELGKNGNQAYAAASKNASVATQMAARYIATNEAVTDLQKNWEDYSSTLSQLNEAYKSNDIEAFNSLLYDQEDNVSALSQTVSQLIGGEDGASVSAEFLAQNMDLITEAMNGNEDAIDALQIKYAEGLELEMQANDTPLITTIGEDEVLISDWLENLPEGELDADDTAILTKYANILSQAGYTADEIEAIFHNMGIDCDVTPIVEKTSTVQSAFEQLGQNIYNMMPPMGQAIIDALGINAKVNQQTDTSADEVEGEGWDVTNVPHPYSVSLPTVGFGEGTMGIPSIQWQTQTLELGYDEIHTQPHKITDTVNKENTSTAVEVSNANHTGGGNISSANKSGSNKPASRGSCFVAGTLISTINGYKNIEDIQVGDLVLSYNEENEENEYSEVLETFIHDTKEEIYSLYIEDEKIEVTGIHRFLINRNNEKKWIPASELQINDLVQFADYSWHKIYCIKIDIRQLIVYNFEVSNNHNYYVGKNGILAHNKGRSCFVAGTPISTINGYKNIEDIRVGDMVLSYNEKTMKNEYSEVLQTMIHFTKDEIYTLYVNNEKIKVTGIHRFLINRDNNNNKWIPASELQVGDKLLLASGELYTISQIDVNVKFKVVYNFEVSNNHNYYVGSNQVLAHNKGGGGRQERPRTTTIRMEANKSTAQKYLNDYKKADAVRQQVNRKTYKDEEYTDRKKYYNERYSKDRQKVYEDKEYIIKDQSYFLRLRDEIDRYHDINKELQRMATNLEGISQRKERAFGKARLDAIDEEAAALKKQLEMQKTLYSEQAARREQLQKSLKKEGAEFSNEGYLTGYNTLQSKKVEKYNKGQSDIIDQRNENIKKLNDEMHSATKDYNNEMIKTMNSYNKDMNKITDNYNTTVAASDEKRNKANKDNTDKWYKDRIKSAKNQQKAEQKSINEYNESMEKAVDNYNKNVAKADSVYNEGIQKAWNKATGSTTQAKKDEKIESASKALKKADKALVKAQKTGNQSKIEKAKAEVEKKEKELQQAKNISVVNASTPVGTEKEVSEDKGKAYNAKIERLEDQWDKSIDKANNKFDRSQADADLAFENNQNRIKEFYEDKNDLIDYTFESLEQAADHAHEEEIRVAGEVYDEKKHYIDTIREIQEEGIESEYDQREYAANKVYEGEELIADRREETLSQWKDDLDEDIAEIEETETSMDELGNSIQETANKIYDLMLEKAQYTVQVKVQIADNVLKTLEAYLDNLGDVADTFGDRLAYMSEQMRLYNEELGYYQDGIRDVINSTGDVDNSLMQRLMTGTWNEDDLTSLVNTDLFTADKVATLEEYRDSLMGLLESQRALREQMYSNLSEVFDKYNNNLAQQTEKISTLMAFTQTYKNIIGIVGKKVLDVSGEVSKGLSKAAFDQQRANTSALKSQLDFLESSLADLEEKKRYFESLNDADYSEEINKFKEQIDTITQERNSAQQSWLESWEAEVQAAQDYFVDALDTIVMHFEQSIAGSMGTLSALSEEYNRQKQIADVYVEDYEKIYQLSKLSREVQASIDDSDQIKNKQALKKLQQEINAANEDGVKMSQYDLDVLRKKYEIELARDELEESRNAKSQVRMMRDAEGNYGYVYTADANAVADAEQNYEDKLHEMQVLNTDYIKSLQDQIIQADQECRDAIAALNMADFASMEEYMDAVHRIEDDYTQLRQEYEQQIGNAIGNNRELYTGAWQAYSEMTGYKISADELYLDKFTETQYSVLTGFASMKDSQEAFVTGLSTAVLEAIKIYQEAMNMNDVALNDGETSIKNFGEDVIENLNGEDGIVDQTNKAAEAAEDLSKSYQNSFRTIAQEAADFAEKYVEQVTKTVGANLLLIDTIAKVIEAEGNLDGSRKSRSTSSGIQTEEITAKKLTVDQIADAGLNTSQKNYVDSDDVIKKYIQGYINNYVGQLQEQDARGQKDLETNKKALASLDSGGYTGNWNSIEGKLALLHEKELVLNAQDTENLLSAVGMIRQISQTIDLNALTASQFMGGLFSSSSGMFNNKQTLEQQVTITAEFPNATDHTEIIEAFDGLINLAAQYANESK